MQNLRAIIFDCFGVIYPNASKNHYERNMTRFAGSEALLDELNLQIDLGHINRDQFYQKLGEFTGLDPLKIRKEIDNEWVADRNLVKVITQLKSRYKIGLLSNAGKEEIEVIYRDGHSEIFDTVIVSYEVSIVKPDKRIYELMTRRMEVSPEECLFVDDSLNNLSTAEDMGMKTLHYKDYGKVPKLLEDLAQPLGF